MTPRENMTDQTVTMQDATPTDAERAEAQAFVEKMCGTFNEELDGGDRDRLALLLAAKRVETRDQAVLEIQRLSNALDKALDYEHAASIRASREQTENQELSALLKKAAAVEVAPRKWRFRFFVGSDRFLLLPVEKWVDRRIAAAKELYALQIEKAERALRDAKDAAALEKIQDAVAVRAAGPGKRIEVNVDVDLLIQNNSDSQPVKIVTEPELAAVIKLIEAPLSFVKLAPNVLRDYVYTIRRLRDQLTAIARQAHAVGTEAYSAAIEGLAESGSEQK